MAEKPIAAIRKKPKSSLMVGPRPAEGGQVRRVHLRRQHRRHRWPPRPCCSACTTASCAPPSRTPFPTADDPVVVLDGGANVDCAARELVGLRLPGHGVRPRCARASRPRWSACSTSARRTRRAPPMVKEAHLLLKTRARPQLRRQHRGPRHRRGPCQARAHRRGGLRRLRRQRRAQVLRIGGAPDRAPGQAQRPGDPRARRRARGLPRARLFRVRRRAAARREGHLHHLPRRVLTQRDQERHPRRGAVGAGRAEPAHRGRVRGASPRAAHEPQARSRRSAAWASPCPHRSSPTTT